MLRAGLSVVPSSAWAGAPSRGRRSPRAERRRRQVFPGRTGRQTVRSGWGLSPCPGAGQQHSRAGRGRASRGPAPPPALLLLVGPALGLPACTPRAEGRGPPPSASPRQPQALDSRDQLCAQSPRPPPPTPLQSVSGGNLPPRGAALCSETCPRRGVAGRLLGGVPPS